MDVTQLLLHLSPSGLQKAARRNCASSLVELAVNHAEGPSRPSVVNPAGLLGLTRPSAPDARNRLVDR